MKPNIPAIKARLAAATPGPWVVEDRDVRAPDEKDVPRGYNDRVYAALDCATKADAALIANAPADLAALVAEVERLEAEVRSLRKPCVQSGASSGLAPGSIGRCSCGAQVGVTGRGEIMRHFPPKDGNAG